MNSTRPQVLGHSVGWGVNRRGAGFTNHGTHGADPVNPYLRPRPSDEVGTERGGGTPFRGSRPCPPSWKTLFAGPEERHPMKRTLFAAAPLATTLLASGCAAEAVTGASALQAAQGNAGQVSGGFDPYRNPRSGSKPRVTQPGSLPNTSRCWLGEWNITASGWKRGPAVADTLTNATAVVPGGIETEVEGAVDLMGRAWRLASDPY